jgi:hypothetical protein
MENNDLCDQYMKYQLEGTMEKYPFVWSVYEIPIRGNNAK